METKCSFIISYYECKTWNITSFYIVDGVKEVKKWFVAINTSAIKTDNTPNICNSNAMLVKKGWFLLVDWYNIMKPNLTIRAHSEFLNLLFITL